MKNLLRNIKALFNTANIKKYTFIQCLYCGSHEVSYGEIKTHEDGSILYPVTCNKCGAIGKVQEKWWNKQ